MNETGPDPLRIRRALAEDLPAIVGLLADDALGSSRERPELPLATDYVAAFAEMSAQQGNELWLAEIADEVVGCLQLTMIAGVSRLGTKRAQIEAVRVSGRYRGRQIGERLMRHAIERAREQGCSLVQLTTDRARGDAHRFYERLGFTASHVGMKLAL